MLFSDPCSCPTGFTTWAASKKGSCYKRSTATATFDAARTACQSLGPCADLVAVDEVGENTWLEANLISRSSMPAIVIHIRLILMCPLSYRYISIYKIQKHEHIITDYINTDCQRQWAKCNRKPVAPPGVKV